MQNGRYFAARLAPGSHTFVSDELDDPSTVVTLEPAGEYYLEIAPSPHDNAPKLTPPAQALAIIKKLKPSDKDRLQDKRAFIPALQGKP